MPAFQFSLQTLLELRRSELRQIEQQAATAAAEVSKRNRRHQELLRAMTIASNSLALDQWMVFQHGAQKLRQQADESRQEAAEWEAAWSQLLEVQATKRTEVEALEVLRENEHQEHQRRERRKEESRLQEQILRQWMLDASAASAKGSGQQDEQGSMSHG